MSTKLKINLAEGLLEVEGNEKFVKSIYEDFKKKFIPKEIPNFSENPAPPSQKSNSTNRQKTTKKTSQSSSPKSKRKGKTKTPSLVKDLNLRPSGKTSLNDFVAALKVKSNLDRNTVFLHYLIHELNISEVNQDHIFTCYRHLKARVPAAFYQSLVDTGIKGWIDTSNMENLTLTSIGLNHVEIDLQSTTE